MEAVETRTNVSTLTPEYGVRVLFHSFRYSQGDPELQQLIFVYLHNLRPAWTIDENLEEEISTRFIPLAKQFLNQYKPTTFHADTPETVESSTKSELDAMLGVFSESLDEESVIPTITEHLIQREYRFLRKGRDRKLPSKSFQKTPLTDPWMSHFRYFALEGHPTGLTEFDQMFQEMKKFWEHDPKGPEWDLNLDLSPTANSGLKPGDALRFIAYQWEQHHRGELFFSAATKT
jgi:hypothetical protein